MLHRECYTEPPFTPVHRSPPFTPVLPRSLPFSVHRFARYTPQWPATCPYVTTVGATQGPEQFGVGTPEVACSTKNNNTFITTGGGFSNNPNFKTPSYQSKVVTEYLSNKSHSLGPGFNAKGRGYPDVALIGHLYPIINGGEVNIKDGTSASTPVMAAIIGLVNSRRLAANKVTYFLRSYVFDTEK